MWDQRQIDNRIKDKLLGNIIYHTKSELPPAPGSGGLLLFRRATNVSSNCLPESMQNHIGCICWTFLHCAFSNVSSNCLPKRMQIHIDCNCLTFLHVAFLNVFFLSGCKVTLVFVFKCVLKWSVCEDA